MLVGIMQSNQQFMQALLTRENPTEKMLFQQLQEVKAVAAAPKEDELESFAEKLQKMKMVSDMLGGGGGGHGRRGLGGGDLGQEAVLPFQPLHLPSAQGQQQGQDGKGQKGGQHQALPGQAGGHVRSAPWTWQTGREAAGAG